MRVEIHTRRLAGAIVAALAASVLIATPALAQQKTVKQCTDEWRANKDANQAKNILLTDYVTQCRAGTAAAPAAAPAAQTKPAAAPAAQQKTVKQCTDEWRANKDANQAKNILLKDYVKDCRAGNVAAAPAAPAAQPKPAAAAPEPATPPRETTAVAPAGSFANETLARARCPTDTVVWVNTDSKIYHFHGTKDYGHTKDGTYMCEKSAIAAGNRAAKNETHP